MKVQVSAFNEEKAPASMGLLALWNFAKLRCCHRMNGGQSADRKGWLMDPRSPNEWWAAAPVVIADMEINMELAKHESEFISIDKSAWIFLVYHLNNSHKSRYLTGDVTTIKADHAWHLLLFTWWWLHLWGIKQDIKRVIASSHRAGNLTVEVVLWWSLCVKYGHCCGLEKAA